jgi:hypothetical protein
MLSNEEFWKCHGLLSDAGAQVAVGLERFTYELRSNKQGVLLMWLRGWARIFLQRRCRKNRRGPNIDFGCFCRKTLRWHSAVGVALMAAQQSFGDKTAWI